MIRWWYLSQNQFERVFKKLFIFFYLKAGVQSNLCMTASEHSICENAILC